MEKPDRREGRYITALDVADRLLPDLNINEVMLWSPDLFAYTSYILTMTSAYQLVVSPPSKQKWQPDKSEIVEWLCDGAEENFRYWYDSVRKNWGGEEEYDFTLHYKQIEKWKNRSRRISRKTVSFKNSKREISEWEYLVRLAGRQWRRRLNKTKMTDFDLIDDNKQTYDERRSMSDADWEQRKRVREKRLLEIMLKNTPPLLLACWAFFYRQVNDPKFDDGCSLKIADLLCNQEHIQSRTDYRQKLWRVSQALLTMHAISDVASEYFGLKAETGNSSALEFAEKLLFGRLKGHPEISIGGSLATFHAERCRVLPKRHNPSIGITLRSLSSNLAFHQSSVDVVWRKTQNNTLGTRLCRAGNNDAEKKLSLLLLPFPLTVRAKDFGEEKLTKDEIVKMTDEYGFFNYEPYPKKDNPLDEEAQEDKIKNEIDTAVRLIGEANEELSDGLCVDIVLFPETSLNLWQFNYLQTKLKKAFKNDISKTPSIIIAGVRESREALMKEINERFPNRNCGEEDFNFSRNAVYCQYFDKEAKEKKGEPAGSYYNKPPLHLEITPKYKQYKHHRWQLDRSQIRNYGLSNVLDPKKVWWESIKIPKRRVSFLNVGDRITISHLICEDLARQDPIAELVRHVGPSLVVTILMDGPQLRNRWSARYATVLSDDPGCSVITLTSLGMVKRHNSEFGLMSRVIALWNESNSGHSREIELAQGAEAVLLTLHIDEIPEKTADGREERIATSVVKLDDVIQIYPNYPNKDK